MDYNQIGPNQEIYTTGLIYDLNSLFAYLQRVPDDRKAQGKQYALSELLVLILLAKLGGKDKPTGITEWIAHRIEQLIAMKIWSKERAPCHMPYRRILQDTVKPEDLERLLSEFHQSQLENGEEIVLSIDGKTMKGTISSGQMRGIHFLSIYVPDQGLVLAEAEVDRKENEIVVAPKILKQVHLSGAIVVGDALHTQRKTSAQIVEAGGDYV
jgi:hypothetical protein